MNSHSVNEWLQINQSSPTAWHTGQICLSAGLLVCISCHKSVTESEIDQSVVKTLYFRTMLRSSRGCLKPEFLLLLHNKSFGPRCSGMSWQEVARVVHSCHVCFHVLASCCVAWVCPSWNSVDSWASTTISSAGKHGHTHSHKDLFNNMFAKVGGLEGAHAMLTHVLSGLRSSAKFKVCSKTILQIHIAQVNPVLDDSP